jgi:transketolase
LTNLDSRSKALRQLAINALEGGERGHIGSTMSLIEIFRVLYDDVLSVDPSNPGDPDRDRVILSKGHGCIALYALLADKGYFPERALETFCRFDSILGGHPERSHVPGIDVSTGSLGHGLSVGVGMAYAARFRSAPFRVFVVLGDGELNEGSVWEAAIAAGHHKLENLTVIVDNNGLQSYGPLESVWKIEPLVAKWESFGFETHRVNGHDVERLKEVLQNKSNLEAPTAIIAETVKGKGISFAEGAAGWHHKARLSQTEILSLRKAVQDA